MLRPSIRIKIRERLQREKEFDKIYNVDTVGNINQVQLKVNNPNQIHAVSYGGSDPKYFREAINSLLITYSNFTFIDFGSGKGRAILMATEYPFKDIVGVEFSEELHNIAVENIKSFKNDEAKCLNIKSVCMDVLDYQLPDAHCF